VSRDRLVKETKVLQHKTSAIKKDIGMHRNVSLLPDIEMKPKMIFPIPKKIKKRMRKKEMKDSRERRNQHLKEMNSISQPLKTLKKRKHMGASLFRSSNKIFLKKDIDSPDLKEGTESPEIPKPLQIPMCTSDSEEDKIENVEAASPSPNRRSTLQMATSPRRRRLSISNEIFTIFLDASQDIDIAIEIISFSNNEILYSFRTSVTFGIQRQFPVSSKSLKGCNDLIISFSIFDEDKKQKCNVLV